MGYRSTFITTESWVKLPEWFVTKYERVIWMADNIDGLTPYKTLPIASKQEGKMYGMFSELIEDLQHVLDEQTGHFSTRLTLMVLHEDGQYEKHDLEKKQFSLTA
jgi:hypothetical protein